MQASQVHPHDTCQNIILWTWLCAQEHCCIMVSKNSCSVSYALTVDVFLIKWFTAAFFPVSSSLFLLLHRIHFHLLSSLSIFGFLCQSVMFHWGKHTYWHVKNTLSSLLKRFRNKYNPPWAYLKPIISRLQIQLKMGHYAPISFIQWQYSYTSSLCRIIRVQQTAMVTGYCLLF